MVALGCFCTSLCYFIDFIDFIDFSFRYANCAGCWHGVQVQTRLSVPLCVASAVVLGVILERAYAPGMPRFFLVRF